MTKFEPEKMDWRDDPLELSEALLRTSSVGQEIVLWQVIDGKRVVVKALVHYIMTEQRIIVLEIPKDLKGFKADLEFYVKLHDRDALFATNMFKRQKDKLFLCFPTRYRIKENREDKRVKFGEEKKVRVVMRKTESDILGQSQFDFELTDISSSGLGASIGLSKLGSLSNVKKLEVLSIGRIPMKTPLMGEVVNISKQGKGINQYLKIGLKFEKSLSEEFISNIF